MYYLVEDPTYPLVALGLAAFACLVALQVTQQGKYLIRAVILLGVGVALFAVERLVVTDAERVEAVVHAVADAVRNSDAAGVEAHLAPDVQVTFGPRTERGTPVRSLLPMLGKIRFDFLKVTHLEAQAGAQTRRGTASFKASTSGVLATGFADQPFAAANTEWSFGVREESPGVWKVTRISAIRLPGHAAAYLGGGHRFP